MQCLHGLAGRRRMLVVLALAAAIGCGRGSAARVDEGRNVASAFLDEVRAGRVDPAWQTTSVEFKSLMGSDSLRDYVKAHPALKAPAEFVASRPVASNVGRMVEYEFRATAAPAKANPKAPPPSPTTIRVLVSFAESPPRVERLTLD